MENGRPPMGVEKDGGLMRRNGLDEARRPFDKRPTRLCFGEPRLALMGVVVVVVGTDSDTGFLVEIADFIGDVGFRMNLEGLIGVPSKFFDRFEGELKMAGSTFSESSDSSKVVTERRRLPGDTTLCFEGGEETEVGIAIGRTCELLVLEVHEATF